MSTDKQRKGSLAWRSNSKRGLRSMIPVVPKTSVYKYFIKVETRQLLKEGVLSCVSVLRQIPLKKLNPENSSDLKYILEYSALQVKKARKKDAIREINCKSLTELEESFKDTDQVDVIGLTKGKGTLGPVQVCGLSLGLRKTKRGFTRRPGSMGGRKPGRIFPTKPFAKKMGNSRRTIHNLKVLDYKPVENYKATKYFSKQGLYLYLKGTTPGSIGTTLALRPSIRKR